MTGGCAKFSAPPPLAVEIPDDCDRLNEPVKAPALIPGEDLGVRAAKYAAAYKEAHSRQEKANACNRQVRESFSKGKD